MALRYVPKLASSLVELVIVVVILGIIAAIALARLPSGSEAAKSAALEASLEGVRSAIGIFAAEHNGRTPDLDENGNKDLVGDNFAERLVKKTDINGVVDPAGSYGPYLATFPPNPFNGLNTVRIGGTAPGKNTHGWYLDQITGVFSPDDSEEHSSL